MSRFDPELWRSRAIYRFRRAPSDHRGSLGSTLVRDLDAVNDIEVLVGWCTDNLIDVEFTPRAGGHYTPGKAVVNCNLGPEKQFHVLLHECGHHIVGCRDDDPRFKRGYTESDPTHRRTTAHRIDVLHEEMEAWHEGLVLAGCIGIYVDRDRYTHSRSEYVKSYLKWVLRTPGYEGGLKDEQPTEPEPS